MEIKVAFNNGLTNYQRLIDPFLTPNRIPKRVIVSTNQTHFLSYILGAEPTFPDMERYNFRVFSAIAGSSESRQARHLPI